MYNPGSTINFREGSGMNWARMLASYGQKNRTGWKDEACSLD